MGKRKKKKIKSGIKYEPPDGKMGNPTAVEIQASQSKAQPPDTQLSDSELRLRKLERLERELHRSRIGNKIDELRLTQLLAKLDGKRRRLIATRYCYPDESLTKAMVKVIGLCYAQIHEIDELEG